ncbi:MAG: hypothetical protein Q7U76_15965 [Nitrospirota bacterium]|nr:hypothetical protein [Nitrospirota bacterium]
MGDQTILYPSPSHPATESVCAAGGLLVTEYYLDLQDDTSQIGITGLRCTSCGEVVDPVILRNRLNQTPDL